MTSQGPHAAAPVRSRPAPVCARRSGPAPYRGSKLVPCAGPAAVLRRSWSGPENIGPVGCLYWGNRLRRFCLGPAPDSVSSSLVLRRPRICLSWSAVCIGETIAPVLRRSCARPALVLHRSCTGTASVLRRSCAGLVSVHIGVHMDPYKSPGSI